MDDTSKRLALLIAQHLQAEAASGMLNTEECESLDVARNCVLEAYKIDADDPTQVELLALPGADLSTTLRDLLVSYLNSDNTNKNKTGSSNNNTNNKNNGKKDCVEDSQRQRAEALKNEGNALVSKRSYMAAVEKYTEAIAVCPDNAVYYSNRAAAYSQMNQHEKAITDAEKAIEIDPAFTKAYSRLGHAQYSMKKYKEAADTYMQGLALEPTNASMKQALEQAEQMIKKKTPAKTNNNNSSTAADGGNGMDGLRGLLGNPQLMSAAQKMMAENPQLAEMALNMANQPGGFDMNRISSMLNDPNIMNRMKDTLGGGSSNSDDVGTRSNRRN